MKPETLDHTGVLNFAAKYLAREAGKFADPWRFPLIDSCHAGEDTAKGYEFNRVTFVWIAPSPDDPQPVSVTGTFSKLHDPIPLETVFSSARHDRSRADGDEPTTYRAVTVRVRKGQVHTYKFLRDNNLELDPINPQIAVLDNGRVWSRFFTQECTVPLSFERWELDILMRLTNHVLPFRTPDAKRFMDLYYNKTPQAHIYRLEQPVGAVNFIDKLVAREEHHRLEDYRRCLRQIDKVLRKRHPGLAPSQVPLKTYEDLYQEMASDSVNDWDKNEYESPKFFLQILRRHTYTGAFSHPKYGGNAGAAAWAYLETFRVLDGKSCFDWRRSIEQPLGMSTDYFG